MKTLHALSDDSTEHVLSDRRAVVVRYRDRWLTLPLVLIGLAVLGYLVWRDQRQELDCSRISGVCTLAQRSLAGAVRVRHVPLSTVVSIGLYKVEAPPNRALQGLELWTESGSVRLAPTQPCAPGDVPCPGEQTTALAKVQSFLKNDAQASIHVQYSAGSGTIATASTLLVAFALVSLFAWQHVNVTISSFARRVVVSKRWACFFLRRRAFALDAIRKAVFVETRMGTKRSSAVSLVLDGEIVTLAQAPSDASVAQRFVDDLNQALQAAREIAVAPEATTGRESVSAPQESFRIDDPIVLASSYRGWTRIGSLVAAAVTLLALVSNQRQELHCSRQSRECRLETHRVLGIRRRTVALDAVTGVALYKVERGKDSAQGIELLTDSAPADLPASEGCRGSDLARFCAGESAAAYEAARTFLRDTRVQRLDTGYGAISQGLFALDACFALLLLGTVLQWQSFRISISPSDRSVSIFRRRALIFTRRFELQLRDVQGAAIDEKRDDAKASLLQRAQLLTREGPIWLNWGWSEPNSQRRQFVSLLNFALAAARMRAGLDVVDPRADR